MTKHGITEAERFWSKVEKTDTCWLWQGYIRPGEGNGYFTTDRPKKSSVLAHRYSYQLMVGELTIEQVLEHTCDNNSCVNPVHLTARLKTPNEVERFWSKVTKLSESQDGCWLWCGQIERGGYGRFTLEGHGKPVFAHRYSWELYTGRKLASPAIKVCHKCDVRMCVNPAHLFVGSTEDNNHDCIAKGRNACGEKSGRAKLNVEKVKEILSSDLSDTQLAEKFGVSNSTIARVRRGDSWTNLVKKKNDPVWP